MGKLFLVISWAGTEKFQQTMPWVTSYFFFQKFLIYVHFLSTAIDFLLAQVYSDMREEAQNYARVRSDFYKQWVSIRIHQIMHIFSIFLGSSCICR